MLILVIKQVVLFIESLLELMDIHFERAKHLENQKVQYQAACYMDSSANDVMTQLGQTLPERLGLKHCWLSLLVVMWVSALSVTVAAEWIYVKSCVVFEISKTYLVEQYQFAVAFTQELSKVLYQYGQSQSQKLGTLMLSLKKLIPILKSPLRFEQ